MTHAQQMIETTLAPVDAAALAECIEAYFGRVRACGVACNNLLFAMGA